jgi:hypothetical protein
VTRCVLTSQQNLSSIELPRDRTRSLANRTTSAPGLRIFNNALADRQQTRAPIYVGLPLFARAFLP